ncbi:MAG: hypothetical protein WC451_05290 [Patescibacteria group bacterium]
MTTKTEAKHTELPWNFERATSGFRKPDTGDLMILNEGKICPAIVWSWGGSDKTGNTNAAFIVRACNNFEGLLEACKASLDALTQNKTFAADIDAVKIWLGAAITKAEG